MTAHHVVAGSRAVAVLFQGSDEPVAAKVVTVSAATDVAVLKVDASPPGFLPLASPAEARVGRGVFTLGFPRLDLLGTEPKFTDGTISALSGIRGDASFMQMSVPVQPGNSGGPLVTDEGKVVGVVISRANDARFLAETGVLPQNVNWASKVQNIRALLSSDPPDAEALRSREEAIERASRAVCIVGAFRDAARGEVDPHSPARAAVSEPSVEPDDRPRVSDSQIRARLIDESIAAYDGSCPCPYSSARDGSRCGGRSAHSKYGGEEPLCYPRDVSPEMVEAYRARRDAE